MMNTIIIVPTNSVSHDMVVPSCDKFHWTPGYHPLGDKEIFLAAFLTSFIVAKRLLYTPVYVNFFVFR